MKMLKETHFNDIVCYGSFDYDRFDLESSFSLVIKAIEIKNMDGKKVKVLY